MNILNIFDFEEKEGTFKIYYMFNNDVNNSGAFYIRNCFDENLNNYENVEKKELINIINKINLIEFGYINSEKKFYPDGNGNHLIIPIVNYISLGVSYEVNGENYYGFLSIIRDNIIKLNYFILNKKTIRYRVSSYQYNNSSNEYNLMPQSSIYFYDLEEAQVKYFIAQINIILFNVDMILIYDYSTNTHVTERVFEKITHKNTKINY